MTLTRARLLGAGLAAALAAGSLLVAPPPAHAAPVLTDARLRFDGGGYGYTEACPPSSAAPPPGPSVAIVENAAPASASHAATRTFTAKDDATDKVTSTVALQGRASSTTSGGRPTSLAMSFDGTITTSATKDISTKCNAYTRLGIVMSTGFTLTTSTWVTLTIDGRGPGATGAEIWQTSGDVDVVRSDDIDGAGSSTVLLPAGDYGAALSGNAWYQTNTTYSGARSGSASITFAPVGSASKAPSGKARKYVTLPGARACTTHDATVTLTARKKRIKEIEKVSFSVNGTKAATLKGKKLKKGRAVVLPLADSTAVDITATVALENGRKRKVSATYLACTR
jgi:hypothetical protein